MATPNRGGGTRAVRKRVKAISQEMSVMESMMVGTVTVGEIDKQPHFEPFTEVIGLDDVEFEHATDDAFWSRGDNKMKVPMGRDPLSLSVRMHEMTHAVRSPRDLGEVADEYLVPAATLNAFEDLRIESWARRDVEGVREIFEKDGMKWERSVTEDVVKKLVAKADHTSIEHPESDVAMSMAQATTASLLVAVAGHGIADPADIREVAEMVYRPSEVRLLESIIEDAPDMTQDEMAWNVSEFINLICDNNDEERKRQLVIPIGGVGDVDGDGDGDPDPDSEKMTSSGAHGEVTEERLLVVKKEDSGHTSEKFTVNDLGGERVKPVSYKPRPVTDFRRRRFNMVSKMSRWVETYSSYQKTHAFPYERMSPYTPPKAMIAPTRTIKVEGVEIPVPVPPDWGVSKEWCQKFLRYHYSIRASVDDESHFEKWIHRAQRARYPFSVEEDLRMPPLTKRIPMKKEPSRLRRPKHDKTGMMSGSVVRARIDGKPFRRKMSKRTREMTGSVLLDFSGSMHPSWEEIDELLSCAPYAVIAGYSGNSFGNPGNKAAQLAEDPSYVYRTLWGKRCSAHGGITILSSGGMRAESFKPDAERDPILRQLVHGGNANDHNGMLWLIEQPMPRIWVSDARVDTGEGAAACLHLARKHGVRRFDTVKQLVATTKPGR